MDLRFKFVVALGMTTLAGCDTSPRIAGVSGGSCKGGASLTPTTASIHVADTVRLVTSLESGCPAPLLRNDTPGIIRLESISSNLMRVTGLTVGTGHVRALSPLDTTIAAEAAISVTP
jgi:hypothetical protein